MQSEFIKSTSQQQLELETLPECDRKNSEKLTSLLSDFRAKICRLLESGQVLEAVEADYSLRRCGLLSTCDPVFLSLKTSKVCLQATEDKTLKQSCEKLPTLGFMSANGNCLIHPGFYPKIESGFTLSDILQETVEEKYFLSEKALQRVSENWGGAVPTLQARDYKGIGNQQMGLVECCAMRGRNPDNPSDRTTGSPTEQRIEVNSQGTTNTLTSVTKDNLIICQN